MRGHTAMQLRFLFGGKFHDIRRLSRDAVPNILDELNSLGYGKLHVFGGVR